MQKEPDLDNIESKAKAARPGPYAVERREIDCGYFDYIVHSGKGDVAWCREELDRKAKANAAYLAALDPATVLALVAEARAYRALKAEWERPATTESDWLEFCQDFDWEVTT